MVISDIFLSFIRVFVCSMHIFWRPGVLWDRSGLFCFFLFSRFRPRTGMRVRACQPAWKSDGVIPVSFLKVLEK